jgi:hypothetical protein
MLLQWHPLPAGKYKIRSVGANHLLHADAAGDKMISTRCGTMRHARCRMQLATCDL